MLDRLERNGNTAGTRADIGALSLILTDLRDSQTSQNVLGAFTDPTNLANPTNPVLGGLLGILFSGGGVLGCPPAEHFDEPQGIDGCLLPLVQTVFYPCDPSVTFDTEDMDVYPSVPGVAVAITSEPVVVRTAETSSVVLLGGADPGTIDVGSAGFDDLGSVAIAATPWQTTRCLRLGNHTPDEIVIHIRFCVETGNEELSWLPTEPDDADGEWTTYRLSPGESADVMVGEWRVNARKIRIFAESSTTNWNTFRDTDLDLVPDNQYQSEAPQVFHYTVQ